MTNQSKELLKLSNSIYENGQTMTKEEFEKAIENVGKDIKPEFEQLYEFSKNPNLKLSSDAWKICILDPKIRRRSKNKSTKLRGYLEASVFIPSYILTLPGLFVEHAISNEIGSKNYKS